MGKIVSDVIIAFSNSYGSENVIDTYIQETQAEQSGLFEIVDDTDGNRLYEVAKKYKVDTIIHLASLLSATAEKDPQKAWDLNMGGLMNALEVARELELQVFNPSSIAAFGPSTPPDDTPQETFLRPNTMYGEIGRAHV